MIINSDCKYTTTDGRNVDYSSNITAESAKYKYAGDLMAKYLDLSDWEDECTGDVEWDIYARRFGKRILCTDDRGFVWVTKFDSEDEAKAEFMLIAEAYCQWDDRA